MAGPGSLALHLEERTHDAPVSGPLADCCPVEAIRPQGMVRRRSSTRYRLWAEVSTYQEPVESRRRDRGAAARRQDADKGKKANR